MTLDRLKSALADRYLLERELGAGGMATVYLAHDLKHDRKVAIKVLKPELAAVIGADRFVVEIRTTASLQHPHILPLFDSGRAGGHDGVQEFLYYVMPYIEGETLRAKLDRETQLGIDEAVSLTAQVADALDYAHRRGVIHRDIKPENILLHDGRPMVADFGIALALSAAAGGRLTETGMSLGTPHYMSPEQATADKEITGRSDIYSLGSVLYEMLAGEPPHIGHSAQQIIMKIIAEEVQPVTRHRKAVPTNVAAAVAKSLEKLPADRFESAKAFAAALTDRGFTVPGMAAEMSGGRATGRSQGRAPLVGWGVAAVLGGVALWGWVGRTGRSAGPSVYDTALPDSAPMAFVTARGATAYGASLRNLTVSPDGDFAIFTARQGDSTLLWYRDLRDGDSHPLVGTTGAIAPRISPDGKRLAYLVTNALMVLPIEGGTPRRVVDAQGPVTLQWLSPTELLYLDIDGYRVSRVDADGGSARSTSIPRCVFGTWIPELQRLLCSYNRTAMLLDPETGERSFITTTRSDGSPGGLLAGTAFRFLEGKYIAYISMGGDLMAAKYDPATLRVGRSVTVGSGIRREALGEGQFDFAEDGRLVYAPGTDATVGRIVRLKRGGTPEPLPLESADFQRYDLSPDGRWLAATIQVTEGMELRVYDLRDGQRYTWLRSEAIRHPLWSRDGAELIVALKDSLQWNIVGGAPDPGARPSVLHTEAFGVNVPDPIDYHDTRTVLTQDFAGSMVTRFDPTQADRPLDTLIGGVRFPSISPNGRLLAVQTLEASQIIVTSYPVPGRQRQVATGGAEPLWLSSSELLYRSGFEWMLVRVDPNTGEPVGAPTHWARDPRFSDTSGWSNRPDHQGGIIYVQGPAQTTAPYLRVVTDWVDQMKEAVDAANR